MLLIDQPLVSGPGTTPATSPTTLKAALPLGASATTYDNSEVDKLVFAADKLDVKGSQDAKPARSEEEEKEKEFWRVAEKHLVPLKAPWLDFVPVRAEGTVLWVSRSSLYQCHWVSYPDNMFVCGVDDELESIAVADAIQDKNGREMLDFTSGQMSSLLGQ